jgi:hypothetical protein
MFSIAEAPWWGGRRVHRRERGERREEKESFDRITGSTRCGILILLHPVQPSAVFLSVLRVLCGEYSLPLESPLLYGWATQANCAD